MAKIYFIMGKSASGKDSIAAELLADKSLNLRPVILHTTRPMRDGEQDGREYHFTDFNGLEAFRRANEVIEERVYQTVHGPWWYFTVKSALSGVGDGDEESPDYLAIGTLEAYDGYRKFFGEENVIPLYIEVSDRTRLLRAIEREERQTEPKYKELCRRFLADEDDYSEDKLWAAGVDEFGGRFSNEGAAGECTRKIKKCIKCQTEGQF